MATVLPQRLIYIIISRTYWKLCSLRNYHRCVLPHLTRMQCSTFLFPPPCHLQSRPNCRRLFLHFVVRPPHMYYLHSCWDPRGQYWYYQILRRRGRPKFSLCSDYRAIGTRHTRFYRDFLAPGSECTRGRRFQGEPSGCHVRKISTSIQQRVASGRSAILFVRILQP